MAYDKVQRACRHHMYGGRSNHDFQNSVRVHESANKTVKRTASTHTLVCNPPAELASLR